MFNLVGNNPWSSADGSGFEDIHLWLFHTLALNHVASHNGVANNRWDDFFSIAAIIPFGIGAPNNQVITA
jgi:hypothetical protein